MQGSQVDGEEMAGGGMSGSEKAPEMRSERCGQN